MDDDLKAAADRVRAGLRAGYHFAQSPQSYSEQEHGAVFDQIAAGESALSTLLSALRQRDEALAEARQDVCAFAAPWAVTYARDHGLPDGHLHPAHYDILERAGARMDSFTRAILTGRETNA